MVGKNTGVDKDITHEVELYSESAAAALYQAASKRLLDINNWRNYAKGMSADFQLCDKHGKAINGQAQNNLFIRIDIPGPGSSEGSGYDWVRIVELSVQKEETCIKVTTAENPFKRTSSTAHFFHKDATSCFKVYRKGRYVKGIISGRHEAPNQKAENIGDNARNIIMGIIAIAGLADLQWKNLLKGLLNVEE